MDEGTVITPTSYSVTQFTTSLLSLWDLTPVPYGFILI